MVRLSSFRSRGAAGLLIGATVLTACGGSNDALAADAGEDFEVAVGEAPKFDACQSAGEVQNYSWHIVEAPPDMSGDAGKFLREFSSSCSFTLESSMVTEDVGTWVIELTVSDADGEVATDRVSVTVS